MSINIGDNNKIKNSNIGKNNEIDKSIDSNKNKDKNVKHTFIKSIAIAVIAGLILKFTIWDILLSYMNL